MHDDLSALPKKAKKIHKNSLTGMYVIHMSSAGTYVIHMSSAELLMVRVDLNYLSTVTETGY